MAVKFYIESKHFVGAGSTWEMLPDDEGCDTEEEAFGQIERLREIDEDWARGQYRVRSWCEDCRRAECECHLPDDA